MPVRSMPIRKFSLRSGYPQFLIRFEQALRRARMNLAQLRRRTGLSRPTIDRISGGEANPRLDTLDALARALGTTVSDLIGPPEGERADFDGEVDDPLLAPPPAMDWNARWIYEQLVARVDLAELRREVSRLSYPFPSETPDQAIHRAVLDVFHTRQAWIAANQLPRCKQLERAIADRYSIPSCARIEDSVPVRVIDIDEDYHDLIRLLAVAALAAEVTREAMGQLQNLGIGDGFSTAMWALFMRRGSLYGCGIVPLVLTPDYSQHQLNGSSIASFLGRSHHGYKVGSVIELGQMRARLREVDFAVSSCGPGVEEPLARLTRLVRDSSLDVVEFFERLEARGVIGDVMYRFLDESGAEVPFEEITGDLTDLDLDALRGKGPKPLIYATPVSELAAIADRGVSLVHTHHVNRAPILHTALSAKRSPYNFVVVTRGIAEAMLALDPGGEEPESGECADGGTEGRGRPRKMTRKKTARKKGKGRRSVA